MYERRGERLENFAVYAKCEIDRVRAHLGENGHHNVYATVT